jgi:hypothetical protein
MLKTFDPNLTTTTIGSHVVTGFAKGTMLTFDMDDKLYNSDTDSRGTMYRYNIHNYIIYFLKIES